MPRQPAVDRESLFAVLCKSKEAIVENGNIATPAAAVWTELSQQLENKISAKALYTFVKMNRHNIWATLEINAQESEAESPVDTEFDSGTTSSGELSDFQLEVPFEEWVKFIPETVEYNDQFSSSGKRNYTILKPGTWTHIINDLLWKKFKHACTLVFQRAKVYPTVTNKYIDIIGFCKDCQGHVKMTCDSKPTVNSPMVLQCSIEGADISLHTGQSKRFMSGTVRAQISKELCEGRMEPAVWRSAKASELMDFGDPEPSHLPNLATLRKAKQERKDLELGDKDPILSLQLLKYSTPNSGSIRDIGLDKFFCHYWSQTQIHVYKALTKKCPSVVCFDATGSVVRKLTRPNGKSGHIFLYQGVLKGDNYSVPVVQMLSERHDINAIATWLTDWLRSGAAVPKEAVSDFSLAILGALVKAFTPLSDLKSYIDECFRVLRGNQSAKLPPCYIRVDVAHCIKMVCQWDCLKKKSHRVKDFFVRGIAKLLQAQSLDHAKQLIHAITVVALSEAEGDDSSGTPLESERCKKYLKAQIAEDSMIIPDEDVQEVHQVDPCDDFQTDLRDWVSNICEESRTQAAANGDRDNIHFLPEIVPHIIRLASYLPLWTGIMVPLFKSTSLTASSANVEAEFKNVKHGLFKHENLPIRVDRFISRHLSYIEGNMRICSAKAKQEEGQVASAEVAGVTEANPASIITHNAEGSRNMDSSDVMESDATRNLSTTDDNAVENWRGQILPPKKRTRTSYLSSCTEWLHAESSSGAKRVKVGLLKNGNMHQPVKVGTLSLSVLNTCSFDAFCQCLCCTFCDSSAFQNVVMNDGDNPLLQLVKSIATDGVTPKTYLQRADLLSSMFPKTQLRSGAHQIDAQCNISTVIGKTMRNISSVYLSKHCSSQYCHLNKGMTREVPFVLPDISVLKNSGMAQLGTSVEKGLLLPQSPCLRTLENESECPSEFKTGASNSGNVVCAGTVTHTYRFGGIVWVDTDLSNPTEFALSEFPSTMVLQGKTLTLRAVVAFRGSLTKDGLGHYTAYCRRAPSVWELYDDLANIVKTVSETNKILPHAVLYTADQ